MKRNIATVCRNVRVLLLLGAAAGIVSAQPAGRELQIFLLLGQANMAGRAAIEPVDKETNPRIWMFNDKGTWVPAAEPTHLDKPAKAGVGPGMAFARTLLAANPEMQIGLVPCAVGGTPLSRWEKTGDLYAAAVARARQAMTAGRLRGAIWHQGENDSRAGDPAPTYQDRLTRMIADLRAEFGIPRLPFVMGELGRFLDPKVFPQMDLVNAALKKIAATVPATAFVAAEGLKDKGDRSHFDTAAQRDFGRRYGAEMGKLLKSQ